MFKKIAKISAALRKKFLRNISDIYLTGDYEIVFVNFYADWCRFSQHLMPIFEEASNRFKVSLSALLLSSETSYFS